MAQSRALAAPRERAPDRRDPRAPARGTQVASSGARTHYNVTRGGLAVEEHEIEDAVLDYLARHPRAADTARGIANRWLPQQRRGRDQQRVQQVLTRMVAAGRVQSVPLPDGEVLYVAPGPREPQSQD